MTASHKTWIKVLVCTFLMAWIFQQIFEQEVRRDYEANGSDWTALEASDRIHLAWTLGPNMLAQTLGQVGTVHYALSLVCMGMSLLIGAWRWRMALRMQGLPLQTARVLEISLIAHFFNSFLLGSTGGDLLKAYYAARETHHKKAEAVTTVIVDRMIGLFAMLAFAAAFWWPNRNLFIADSRLFLAGSTILAMAGAASLFLYLAWRASRIPQFRTFLANLPEFPGKVALLKFAQTFTEFSGNPSFLLRSLTASMLLNLTVVAQFMILARGLGFHVDPAFQCFLIPAIITISAIPITPSGLGIRENLFVFALASPIVKVPAAKALSWSLLAFSGSLVWSLVGGCVYLWARDREHLEELDGSSAKA